MAIVTNLLVRRGGNELTNQRFQRAWFHLVLKAIQFDWFLCFVSCDELSIGNGFSFLEVLLGTRRNTGTGSTVRNQCLAREGFEQRGYFLNHSRKIFPEHRTVFGRVDDMILLCKFPHASSDGCLLHGGPRRYDSVMISQVFPP